MRGLILLCGAALASSAWAKPIKLKEAPLERFQPRLAKALAVPVGAPLIEAVQVPDEALELTPAEFTVQVDGAVDRVEWDFDGEPGAECVWVADRVVPPPQDCADEAGASWVFRDAGEQQVTVTVYRGVARAEAGRMLRVTEGDITVVLDAVERQLAIGEDDRDPFAWRELIGMDEALFEARLAVDEGLDGNLLVALDKVLTRLIRVQWRGEGFGRELFGVGRQLRRDLRQLRDVVDQGHPAALAESDARLETLDEVLDDPDLVEDLNADDNRVRMIHWVWQIAYEAYFWLARASDPCYAGPFPGIDSPRVAEHAAVINDGLSPLRVAMDRYRATADAPGARALGEPLREMDVLRALSRHHDGFVCPPGDRCLDDVDRIDAILRAIDLHRQLDEFAIQGAYTRNWQACLADWATTRLPSLERRLAFVCGPNSQPAQSVRALAKAARTLPERSQSFVLERERCTIVEAYNACLPVAFPGQVPRIEPRDYGCAPDAR